MFLECLDSGLLSSNCYVIGDSGEAAVIDPGNGLQAISEVLDKEKLTPTHIILTHAHLDHMISLDKLRHKYNAKVYTHAADAEALGDPVRNCSSLFGYEMTFDKEDGRLKHGDVINIGSLKLKVIHTPGHTPGSISILADGIVFTGDTLFRQGVGRADLKGGNQILLLASVKKRLMCLNDDTIVYPGHGPSTTIGTERKHNPFLWF